LCGTGRYIRELQVSRYHIVVKDPISRNFRRVIKKDKRLKHVQQWVLKIDTIKSTTLKDTIKHSFGFGPSGKQ
ncbi:15035_t:CDS:1, partial [Rhizophagus irregularis]